MRRSLACAFLFLVTPLFAGRAATYVLNKGDITQTLVMKRETAQSVSFSFVSECKKEKCKDSLGGMATQDPFRHPTGKDYKGSFAAEEYLYEKGKCRVIFRVDMESASMVKVLASACPEHKKKKCPLEIDGILRLQRNKR
ncbi:MAG: hypothetical protein RL318_3000 [Fibrobacterota bacterium]|jgi:hypothetical protein